MALTQKEIEKYKERLLEMKKQLTQSIKGVKEEVKEQDESRGYSQHQADEGTDDFGRTLSLELTNKESSVVQKIDTALEKIEEGNYGICEISGEEIPKKRLDAVPYATMTVEAQEKLEKGLL